MYFKPESRPAGAFSSWETQSSPPASKLVEHHPRMGGTYSGIQGITCNCQSRPSRQSLARPSQGNFEGHGVLTSQPNEVAQQSCRAKWPNLGASCRIWGQVTDPSCRIQQSKLPNPVAEPSGRILGQVAEFSNPSCRAQHPKLPNFACAKLPIAGASCRILGQVAEPSCRKPLRPVPKGSNFPTKTLKKTSRQ